MVFSSTTGGLKLGIKLSLAQTTATESTSNTLNVTVYDCLGDRANSHQLFEQRRPDLGVRRDRHVLTLPGI